jgi:hypothetical protein
MYGVKHGSQWAQIHEYTHRKALTFLKDPMNKPHPTPEEVSPIYIGWVEKAARLYQQKKDEWKPSAHTSTQNLSDTVSDFLSSVGQHTPTTVTSPTAMDIKCVPPPIPGNVGVTFATPFDAGKDSLKGDGDLVTTAFLELNTPKRPDETHKAFERQCAAVQRLLANPASAPWLTLIGATPSMYIEANAFAANMQTPGIEPKTGSARVKHENITPLAQHQVTPEMNQP